MTRMLDVAPPAPESSRGDDLFQLLTLLRILVLDDVDQSEGDDGKFFIERLMCLLSGNLVQLKPDQLTELDKAIGKEVNTESFRQVFRENAASPQALSSLLFKLMDFKSFGN